MTTYKNYLKIAYTDDDDKEYYCFKGDIYVASKWKVVVTWDFFNEFFKCKIYIYYNMQF